MKAILFFLAASTGIIFAQDASAPNEKDSAIAISQELKALIDAPTLSDTQWNNVDAEIDGYQKQFGVSPQTTNNVVLLRKSELKLADSLNNPEKYDALVQKLSHDPVPEVAALVARIVELKSKPLDLKFTAVDGRAVDLSALRGKVVLIDFWATWCGPCVGEVPNVVSTYQKYHDQGFEIVGISLDEDKDALQSFTASKGMTWPQYFDGQGWKNAISSSFEIHSIPAMWLVNKQGMLVTMDGRNDLEGQVAKLVTAP
jgi:thiol-disulfide isomerase/thioredoxin